MPPLYTIGHSRHPFDRFLKYLQSYGIQFVLDVRSVPYSRYAEEYNKETLASLLSEKEIRYCPMGRFFGARQPDRKLYSAEGYLDFEKVSGSPDFLRAKENVRLGLTQGKRIVLLCTEKDPIDCHRAILVGRSFSLDGIEVSHILADGTIQTQAELDSRLLNRYFPDGDQLTLFSYKHPASREEKIALAYRMRNEEIGYRLP